jgi:hypothetical protein
MALREVKEIRWIWERFLGAIDIWLELEEAKTCGFRYKRRRCIRRRRRAL